MEDEDRGLPLWEEVLHLPLLGEKPVTMKDEEWALLVRQVLGVIRLTLSTICTQCCEGEDHINPDEVWYV